MYDEAVQLKIEGKARDSDIWKWTAEQGVWKYVKPIEPKEHFTFWNPITRKITAVPYRLIFTNLLYLPTNTPGTGERFVTLMLAINGDYDINYDEDDNRFDKLFNYKSKEHKTRIDIYVNRMCKKKRSIENGADQAKTEEEPGQPDAEDQRCGEIQEEDSRP